MAELEWEGDPQRPTLRRATRHRLRRFDPTIRVVAEAFLAETSPIDLLAVGGEGEIVSIRIGQRGEDLVRFTQCLSDLAWLRPRLPDFLKLAPGLGIEPSAAPRAMLLCPEFAPETRSAASQLPSRTIELLTYRCLRERGQLSILLDAAPAAMPASPVEVRPIPSPASGFEAPPFRSSTTDGLEAPPFGSSTTDGLEAPPGGSPTDGFEAPSPRSPARRELGTAVLDASGPPAARSTETKPDRSGFRTGLRDEDLRHDDLEEDKTLD